MRFATSEYQYQRGRDEKTQGEAMRVRFVLSRLATEGEDAVEVNRAYFATVDGMPELVIEGTPTADPGLLGEWDDEGER